MYPIFFLLRIYVKVWISILGSRRGDAETAAKLKFYENKVGTLEAENYKLQNSVQTLEGELEEVQDNFKEDEADEYRNLKRDLETQSKNVRVLQFKLKKSERSISELAAEKSDLESKVRKHTFLYFYRFISIAVSVVFRDIIFFHCFPILVSKLLLKKISSFSSLKVENENFRNRKKI